MEFRISDTFTDSLRRLSGDGQKATKTAAFDLQLNPANPGLKFHKLERARDPNFWSVRVSRDIRLIVHKTASSLLLCYVAHHDKAYQWAERRRLETHPRTGAAQLVELREKVRPIVVRQPVEQEQTAPAKPRLFEDLDDDTLLGYGVPAEWLADVRTFSEDDLLEFAERLPGEAAEALLELATGGQPQQSVRIDGTAPFDHPDAQRRFRTLKDVDELQQALEYPWEKWTVFLHPAQREWVEKEYSGAARVSGSAGTGKTIVALHRTVHLAARHPDARILLTTFSDALANMLRIKLHRLIGGKPKLAERIDVLSMDALGTRLYRSKFGVPRLVTKAELDAVLDTASREYPGRGFSPAFLRSEWDSVVDAWQLTSWPEYRDVQRLGRKTRLPEERRRTLWAICERVREILRGNGWITQAELLAALTKDMAERNHPPYDFAVVDEAQDVTVAQLRFLAALGAHRADALFFAGDLGQRIFQQPFSWRSLEVDIRGRSRTLRVNYRTSHQIRLQADKLLDADIADVDGNVEKRTGTVSVFNGRAPEVMKLATTEDEQKVVSDWLQQCLENGMQPEELALFVRSEGQATRALGAARFCGLEVQQLDGQARVEPGKAVVSTMHLAKGLEFRGVAVMACDDEVIPLQERIDRIADQADLDEVYNTERHLLYVACTRARDRLLVTGVSPVSEFLDDMME